jgi:hypothetical protein
MATRATHASHPRASLPALSAVAGERSASIRSPSARRFFAAFTSRSCCAPQVRHTQCFSSFSAVFTAAQFEQVLLLG